MAAGEHRVEVELELGVERDALDRVAEQFGVAGAFLVGRNGADERLGLRGEHLRGGAEDLGRSLADQHVVGLDLEVGGDRLGELRRPGSNSGPAWRRLRAARAAYPAPLLPGPTGFSLLAMQMTPALDGLQVRLEGGPDAVLAAAAPDAAGESRARADAGGLDELTS